MFFLERHRRNKLIIRAAAAVARHQQGVAEYEAGEKYPGSDFDLASAARSADQEVTFVAEQLRMDYQEVLELARKKIGIDDVVPNPRQMAGITDNFLTRHSQRKIK